MAVSVTSSTVVSVWILYVWLVDVCLFSFRALIQSAFTILLGWNIRQFCSMTFRARSIYYSSNNNNEQNNNEKRNASICTRMQGARTR